MFGAAQCYEHSVTAQELEGLLGRGRNFVVFDYLLPKDSKMLNTNKSSHIKEIKKFYPKSLKRPNGLLKCGILSEHCSDTGAWRSGRGLWKQLPLLGGRMEEQVCLRSSAGVTSLCPPSSFSINPCFPLLPALFPPNLCSHYISLQLDHLW